MPDFKSFASEEKLIDELMPLIFSIGKDQIPIFYGSCFVASPYMIVTAKHVLMEMADNDPGLLQGTPSFKYYIAQISRADVERPSLILWTIDAIGLSGHSDIALVWLRPFNKEATEYNGWKTVEISFHVPLKGEAVTAFGMHNVSFDGCKWNEEGQLEHININLERSISTGEVREHYPNGRDSVMYHFPCVELDARFDGGMSGGLVINDLSQAFAIICGSLKPHEEEVPEISYAATLWPMMAIPVPSKFIDNDEVKFYRLKNLSDLGIINPIGWNLVKIEEAGDSEHTATISFEG